MDADDSRGYAYNETRNRGISEYLSFRLGKPEKGRAPAIGVAMVELCIWHEQMNAHQIWQFYVRGGTMRYEWFYIDLDDDNTSSEQIRLLVRKFGCSEDTDLSLLTWRDLTGCDYTQYAQLHHVSVAIMFAPCLWDAGFTTWYLCKTVSSVNITNLKEFESAMGISCICRIDIAIPKVQPFMKTEIRTNIDLLIILEGVLTQMSGIQKWVSRDHGCLTLKKHSRNGRWSLTPRLTFEYFNQTGISPEIRNHCHINIICVHSLLK